MGFLFKAYSHVNSSRGPIGPDKSCDLLCKCKRISSTAVDYAPLTDGLIAEVDNPPAFDTRYPALIRDDKLYASDKTISATRMAAQYLWFNEFVQELINITDPTFKIEHLQCNGKPHIWSNCYYDYNNCSKPFERMIAIGAPFADLIHFCTDSSGYIMDSLACWRLHTDLLQYRDRLHSEYREIYDAFILLTAVGAAGGFLQFC